MTPDTTRDTTVMETTYTVTITEASKYLDCSVRTVQRRMDAGELEAVAQHGKRMVRLRESDLPPGVTPDATGDILDSVALNMTHGATGDTTLVSTRDGRTADTRTAAAVALVSQVVAETLAQAAVLRPSVGVEHNLLFTLAEAQALNGLHR